MDYLSTSWGGAYVHPSLVYDVRLAQRMNPFGPIPPTLLRLRSSAESLGCKKETVAPSGALLGAKSSFQLQASSKYSEAYIQSFSVGMELQGHDGCVNSVALNPSEKLLMTGSDDQCLCIYDTTDWSLLQRFRTMHRSNIFHAVFCPVNNGRVLSCGADGRTIITDLETIQAHFKCRYSCMATQLAVSSWWPDTAFAAYLNGLVGRIDTRMCSYDDVQPSIVAPSSDEVSEVNSISMHDRWPFLLALSTNSSQIYLHDMRMGAAGALVSFYIPEVGNANCDGVSDVAFSNSGDMIAINYRSNNVYVAPWLKSLYSTDITKKVVDDYIYLSGLRSTSIPSVALQNAICLKSRQNARTLCKKITFMENDSIVCSGGDCGKVFFWRSFDGKLLHSTVGDSDITNEVLYSKSLETLIVSGIDVTTKVMKPNGKKLIDSLWYTSQERGTGETASPWWNLNGNQRRVSAGNEQAEAMTSESAFRGSSVSFWDGDVFVITEHENLEEAENGDEDALAISDEFDEESLPYESDGSSYWYSRHASRIRSGTLLRRSEESSANLQFTLVTKMRDGISLRGLLALVDALKQLKEHYGRFHNLPINLSQVVQLGIQLEELEEREDFSNQRGYQYDESADNGDLFNIIEEDHGDQAEEMDNPNETAGHDGVSLLNDVLCERVESGKEEEYESVSGRSSTRDEVSPQLGMHHSNPTYMNDDAPATQGIKGSSDGDGGSANDVRYLFPKLCVAINVLKRNLDAAFRQWMIPSWNDRETPLKVQVPRWDHCMLGPCIPSSQSIGIGWSHMQLDDILGVDAGDLTLGAQYLSGRMRVRSLLSMMDLLLQGKLNLTRTADELCRYWRFRCVLDTGYIYYFMAVGDTEAALERVNNLERFVEYRTITGLGSVNPSRIAVKRRSAENDEEEKCSAACLLSLCDSNAFPPLLVPLAIRIRILYFSLQEFRSEIANISRDAMELRMTKLVVELRRRMNGHPNVKVCRRVSDMLNNLCL